MLERGKRGSGANGSVEERRRAIDRPFTSFATWVARWTGSHWAFIAAALLVLVGLLTTDIQTTNLAISVVTLLMVLALQNTQNRHSAALHLKLDEVVRAEPEARDEIRGVESRPEREIRGLIREETDDLLPSRGHESGGALPAED
jgi:low affinity Fe/Cu permease